MNYKTNIITRTIFYFFIFLTLYSLSACGGGAGGGVAGNNTSSDTNNSGDTGNSGNSGKTLKGLLWDASYDGPADDGMDTAVAMEVDSDGNVYVTGTSDDGYLTVIKYNPDGNVLWEKRYERFVSTGSGEISVSGVPKAIILDNAGNVYITGRFANVYSTYNSDFLTIKYDTDGNKLWDVISDGGYDGWENYSADIAVDFDGNVYVTGGSSNVNVKTYGSVTKAYWTTIKYDSKGNDQWVVHSSNGNDAAHDIVVDNVGNVYITGTTEHDYLTVKYDTNGNTLWEKRYDGPANDVDFPTDLAIDTSGNVYVTGRSKSTSGGESDYLTVKYNNAGSQAWIARYDGPADGYDAPVALAVDANGNVYVTGTSRGEIHNDYLTIKYDSKGNKLWESRYDGAVNSGYFYHQDLTSNLAIDASGNVYVTGYILKNTGNFQASDGNADYVTVQYDTNGKELWSDHYSRTVPNYWTDKAPVVAVDGQGNAYVTGIDNGDFLTIKYTP